MEKADLIEELYDIANDIRIEIEESYGMMKDEFRDERETKIEKLRAAVEVIESL